MKFGNIWKKNISKWRQGLWLPSDEVYAAELEPQVKFKGFWVLEMLDRVKIIMLGNQTPSANWHDVSYSIYSTHHMNIPVLVVW